MATLEAPPPPATMAMTKSELGGTPMTFILAALLLSLLTIALVVVSHIKAYLATPQELHIFVEAAASSIDENEAFGHDIERLKPDDRPRMIRLLGQIQKCGDDFSEDLDRLMIEGSKTKPKNSALFLWKHHRERLQWRLQRLDLLRQRFLILYMGAVASALPAHEKPEAMSRMAPKGQFARPGIPHSLAEGVKKKATRVEQPDKQPPQPSTPQPRQRLTMAATGHSTQEMGAQHQMSFSNVIRELQLSPKLHNRRASIERRLALPPDILSP